MGGPRRRVVRPVVFACALAIATFAFGLRFQGVTFQTDGIIYADTARQIATGQGVSTRIVQLETAAPTIPQTNWPPLYPALAAGFLVLGLPLQMAMKLVPLLAYAVACGLLGAYVFRRFGGLAAGIFSALMLDNAVTMSVAAQPMSEGVFMGLAAVALLLTHRVVRIPGRWAALGLGVITGAAADTRVLGLGLFPSVIVALCLFRRWRAALWTSLGFVVAAAPLYARNYLLRQYNSAHPLSDMGIISNATRAVQVLGNDLLHSLPELILLGLVVVGIIAVSRRRRELFHTDEFRFTVIGTVIGAGLLGSTIVARTLTYFDVLYTRFISPAEFFLWPVLAVLVVLLIKALPKPRVAKFIVLVWAVLVGVSLVRHFPRPDLMQSQAWVQSERITWVADHLDPDALYVGNRSPGYTFFLNRTALALRAATTPATHEEFDQYLAVWLKKFSTVYLVIEGRITTEAQAPWVIDLANQRNIPENYHPIPSPDGLVVYQLTPPLPST